MRIFEIPECYRFIGILVDSEDEDDFIIKYFFSMNTEYFQTIETIKISIKIRVKN